MNQLKCKCGRCYNITLADNKAPVSNTWTAQAQAFAMRGQDADSLKVIPQQTYTPLQPGAYIETPIAQQNIESNVKVPLAQGLVTGGFIGCMATCATLFFGFPKPVLIVTASTLTSAYITWKGGVNFADSLLTRIEDYTGVDINRDGVTGSEAQRKPQPELRFVSVRGSGQASNLPAYEPKPQEQYIEIPGMPRADVDPWTVDRMVDVLERAFISGRWGRQYCTELGMSQGQWSVLSKYLGSGEDGEGFNVWSTTDRPTLDAFVEDISTPVNHPT